MHHDPDWPAGTARVCHHHGGQHGIFGSRGEFPEGLMDEVHEYMEALEKKTGKGFGDPAKPLLVSVRSGSALSMPGMMDTILNLGLNDETAKA